MSPVDFHTPQRVAQREAALARADEVRDRRAQLKRDLKADRKRVEILLLDPPAWAHNMNVRELLLAVPRIGGVRVNRICARHNFGPFKTVGALTERQRRELLGDL